MPMTAKQWAEEVARTSYSIAELDNLDVIERLAPEVPLELLRAFYAKVTEGPRPGFHHPHVERRKHELRAMLGRRLDSRQKAHDRAAEATCTGALCDAVLALLALERVSGRKAEAHLRAIKRDYLDQFYDKRAAGELERLPGMLPNTEWPRPLPLPSYDPRAGDELEANPDEPASATPASSRMDELRRRKGHL